MENDLISRAALMSVPNVRKVCEYDETGCSITYKAVPVEVIEKAPSIEAEPKWISVEDGLPEDYEERVLVMLNDDCIVGYPRMDTDRLCCGMWVRYGENVTHWMPLPEPPKEEKA